MPGTSEEKRFAIFSLRQKEIRLRHKLDGLKEEMSLIDSELSGLNRSEYQDVLFHSLEFTITKVHLVSCALSDTQEDILHAEADEHAEQTPLEGANASFFDCTDLDGILASIAPCDPEDTLLSIELSVILDSSNNDHSLSGSGNNIPADQVPLFTSGMAAILVNSNDNPDPTTPEIDALLADDLNNTVPLQMPTFTSTMAAILPHHHNPDLTTPEIDSLLADYSGFQ
ncbi:MAG: hypothetical protein K0T99_03850 [Alphaproteobacteria bacterium]|nr:hypothetical protein [Alphaproteobacteria bacterium]